MNFTIFSSVLFAFATIALYAIPSNALSHPVDLKSADVDRHAAKIANYLVKRKSSSKQNGHDCSKKKCSLKLKPCPKDCPQSCGYIDSPDPCCPLLGKPTCPDY